ncbi:DUF551 domain-containing protein [Raoultella planticola]|uniref:DUF551 domain-containing protein n=1 Tax=Raoultella planticola TaxID=575 RepID=UPI001F4FC4A7|nr:DUF551 domain-containing protein [Raoultella planticola]
MTSKISIDNRELLQKISIGEAAAGIDFGNAIVRELAAFRLAAMDSEPVAWVSSGTLDSRLAGIEAVTIPFVPGMDIPLFRHPVVTHDGDFDADPFGFARRSGDLVVIDVNGDPHVRDGMPLYSHAQPAPVVMDDIKLRELFDSWFASDCSFDRSPEASEEDNIAWRESYWYVWQRCRAAMLQAGNSPVHSGLRPEQNIGSPAQSPIDHGNSPVIPDCWIPVSERMPETDGNYWGWWSESKRQGPVWFIKSELQAQFQSHEITHWMPLPAAPQEVK